MTLGPRWKIVITLLFDVLPSDSVLLLLVEVLLLLGVPLIEDEDEVVDLAVHTNGGTLTIPSPDNDPATRCVARSEGGNGEVGTGFFVEGVLTEGVGEGVSCYEGFDFVGLCVCWCRLGIWVLR